MDLPMIQALYDLSCSRPTTAVGREVRRLANKVRDILTRRYDPLVRARIEGFSVWVHASNANPVRFSEGFYDSPIKRILEFIGRPRGVIDIGANVGFTALMAHAVAPQAEYLLIEGDPRSFQLLERNTAVIQRRRLENVVLGDVDGAAQGEFMQQAGTASFVTSGVHAVSYRGLGFAPRPVAHRTARLDTLTAGMPVDYIKIDTDGAETLILAGARETLTKHRPVVFCEFNPSAMVCKKYEPEPMRLFTLFRECGYSRFAFYDQQGRLIVCTDDAQTIAALCDYCMAAETVMDIVTMQDNWDDFMAAERQHAQASVARYMEAYTWR